MIIHELKVVAIIIAPLFRAGKLYNHKPGTLVPDIHLDIVCFPNRSLGNRDSKYLTLILNGDFYFNSGFRNLAVTDCFM